MPGSFCRKAEQPPLPLQYLPPLQMGTSRETVVEDVNSAKAHDIERMTTSHAQAFSDMKSYFSEVTHSNLDLVASLKGELAEVRARIAVQGSGRVQGGLRCHARSSFTRLCMFCVPAASTERGCR